MAIVPVGPDGQVTIGNYDGDVDVVVDVLGWISTGGAFVGLTPARLVDTRPVPPPPTTSDPDLLAGSRISCTFHGPVVTDDVLLSIRTGRASGVILFGENLPSQDRAVRNAAAIQAAAAQSPDPAPAASRRP